jgi:NTE family protein
LAERGLGRVLRQCASILLSEKERAGKELLSRRFPHVTFIEVAPDLGPFGYFGGLQAGPMIMRGYGAGLRALAAAKEAHVFDGGGPTGEAGPPSIRPPKGPR